MEALINDTRRQMKACGGACRKAGSGMLISFFCRHRRGNMREILLTGAGRLGKALLVCTALAFFALQAADQLSLMAGLLVGYAMGIVWYGIMFGRLWRSADMTAAQAKAQVVVGAVLRWLLLGTVLWASLQVSFHQFLAVVTGFGIVYVLGLILLALTNQSA